jgi:hypothetical protein
MGQSLADYGWPATNLVWFANALPQPGMERSLIIPTMNTLLGAGAAVARPALTAGSTDPVWADHCRVADNINRSTSAGGSIKRYRCAP